MNILNEAMYAPVFWITGLSGAGKTTCARSVIELLHAQARSAVLLDGDEFREAIEPDLGHSHEDRLKNAFRIARMSQLISRQGVTVVCATMSLFPEIWAWNRIHIPLYRQIYLSSDRETLLSRDSKGLYQKAQNGNEKNIMGWDIEFQEPTDNDFTVKCSEYSLETLPLLAQKILETCAPNHS